MIIIGIAAAVAILLGICTLRIVPQTQVYVIERLGKFHKTWDAGIHIKIPILDRVVNKVSLKEQILDFPPQPVITKDNVTMRIDSVVFMKVTDVQLYTYGVANPYVGIENLAATTLRNLVGAMDFDETLTSRDAINGQMESLLDAATDAWGIKVNRVEIKNITPPAEIQEVMQKQMTAEREKRQAILEAEAHRQSIVTRAEGEKTAKVLAAEAQRDAQIALAEGQAKSIRMVYEAEAEGLERLSKSNINPNVLKLKSFEALQKVADGNATKIFMPTDIMDTVTNYGVMNESFGGNDSTPVRKKAHPITIQPTDACLHANSSQISRNTANTMYQIDQNTKVEK